MFLFQVINNTNAYLSTAELLGGAGRERERGGRKGEIERLEIQGVGT